MPAEPTGRRFRAGGVPPLAEGYIDRPDTARGILDALAPGSTVALVPDQAFAEGASNWLGACGKTQIAVIIAESLWRSGAIDGLIWISATNRASVLSAYVQASAATAGIEPTGTAESVAARFIGWLSTTSQGWLVVLDDLLEAEDLDELWPEGPTGRVLITSTQSPTALARHATRVIPVGFFSVREALNCLTERLSVNLAQRPGAIDLIEALGREPLAVAQASSVLANSTLGYRDYRDYFARRRQQIGIAEGEVSSAAAVTWTLSLGQAESQLPGVSVRPMLVLLALLDGHGIPGTIFGTPSVAAYLGEAVIPFSSAVDPKPAWDALLAMERAGLISVNQAVAPPMIFMNSVLQAAIRLAAPAQVQDPAARAAASGLLEVWPPRGRPCIGTSAYWRCAAQNSRQVTPAIIAARISLAKALIMADEPAEAVAVLHQATNECEQFHGPVHPDTLSVRDELAAAHHAAGEVGMAIRMLTRTLADRERLHGPQGVDTIITRDRLATAYLAQGKIKDAISHYERALSDCEKVLGRGHPDTIATSSNLAAAYQEAGRMPAALQLSEQTCTESERVLGPDHADTLARLANLAHLYYATGRVGDARALLRETVARCERVLPSEDPLTQALQQSLANIAGDG